MNCGGDAGSYSISFSTHLVRPRGDACLSSATCPKNYIYPWEWRTRRLGLESGTNGAEADVAVTDVSLSVLKGIYKEDM